MRRAVVVAGALAMAGFMGVLGSGVRDAAACRPAPLTARSIPDLVESSVIVAVGQWDEGEARTAVLVVEEGLKGAEVGDRIEVDNRQPYSEGCNPYAEPFEYGGRFVDDERSVVFLEQQGEGGVWQVGFGGRAAFDVPTDELLPLSAYPFDYDAMPIGPWEDAIAAAGTEVGTPELEVELGCGEHRPIEPSMAAGFVSLSSAVAVVTVIEEGYRAPGFKPSRVRVDRLLRGQLPAEFTLNDRLITDTALGDCQPMVEKARAGSLEGHSYLMFLTVDDFGIAEYRPVAWGRTAVAVNDRYVTGGLPTLAGIRVATGHPAEEVVADDEPAAPGQEHPDDVADTAMADEDESGRDGRAAWALAVVIGAVVIGGTGLWVTRRSRPG